MASATRQGEMLYHGRAHAKTILLSRRGNPGQQEFRRVNDSERVFISIFQQRLSFQRGFPRPQLPSPPAAVFSFP